MLSKFKIVALSAAFLLAFAWLPVSRAVSRDAPTKPATWVAPEVVEPPLPSTEFGRMCERGYESQLGVCVRVKVPPHAYLNAFGDYWDCMRGYRELDQRCFPITVPAHGHLTDLAFGKGWECDPGYHDTGDACVAVLVAMRPWRVLVYRSRSQCMPSSSQAVLGSVTAVTSTTMRSPVCPSRSRRMGTSVTRVMIGNVIRAFARALTRASLCTRRRMHTRRTSHSAPDGDASAATRHREAPVLPSGFHRMRFSLPRAMLGSVNVASARQQISALPFAYRSTRTLTIPATPGSATRAT
jgi:hypothetical protein